MTDGNMAAFHSHISLTRCLPHAAESVSSLIVRPFTELSPFYHFSPPENLFRLISAESQYQFRGSHSSEEIFFASL